MLKIKSFFDCDQDSDVETANFSIDCSLYYKVVLEEDN